MLFQGSLLCVSDVGQLQLRDHNVNFSLCVCCPLPLPLPRSLHVWNLSSSTLLRKIDVPDPVNAIKRLQFVWMGRNSSQMVVAALGDTGQVHLIDVENCELVHAIGEPGALPTSIPLFYGSDLAQMVHLT